VELKFIRSVAAGGATIAVLMLGAAIGAAAQAVTSLPSVDLNRFAGSWYEIARLPDKREKGCLADVVDLIALADKKDHLQLVSSCEAKNNYTNVANADIKAEKNSGGGKLKATYLWPFSEKEWILALGPDYEWVLLGNPNHKDLRVLSRTRSLTPDVLSEIKQKAASEGFATDKLAMTLQTGR
jgi:apolipoprotein D and lipocalin family protein